MKKKKIELNAKLFLNKTVVSSLNSLQTVGGGNNTATNCPSNATSPCALCHETQTPDCVNTQITQPVNLCNFATSKIPGDCNPTGNLACQSVLKGACGTIVSTPGGGCGG
ncbi:class I lanthipeptide [Taibaiella koreensis]|uniref:class I lanthipeptide n=1 Tax=Taibaiella koreensis TaxID=1268548 RepID=UPI0013C3583A|nr:class I lanthipeptide [Taibaiella koreensis]